MKLYFKINRSHLANSVLAGMILFSAGACSSQPPAVLTRLQVERVTVPSALLTVRDAPAIPESRLQSAAANYIVRLKINDDECHLDVAAIAATQK